MMSNFFNSETWANPKRGYFWLAPSTLWFESFDHFPYGSILEDLKSFTTLKLDKPMRNSGQILKYANQCLNYDASWNLTDYKVVSSCYPEGIEPTILNVKGTLMNNLHAYENIFEDALEEMRAYFDSTQEVQKMSPFQDNIVVLMPSPHNPSHVQALAEVATKLGLN